MDAIEIKPGTILPNGTTVIAASVRNGHEWIILAMQTHRTAQPYVTWKAARPGDGSDTHYGHYHVDLRKAVDDFYTRP